MSRRLYIGWGRRRLLPGIAGIRLVSRPPAVARISRREFRTTSGNLAPDGEQSILPFRMPYGLPIISLRIDGLVIDAQIDSGGTGLSLPQNFSARLRFATNLAQLGTLSRSRHDSRS